MSVHLRAHRICATLASLVFVSAFTPAGARAQQQGRAHAVFADGQAQVVPAFSDSTQWIRHELWVETEFDTDGDGKPDRMHVAVVRPRQTETEGLKVPIIYESSPYFSGTAGVDPGYFWNVRQELGAAPPVRTPPPPVRQQIRPGISGSLVNTWVPRGFAVVHSEAPGTGLSQGCPTVGGSPEALAPKAVINWLNGRARGFTSPDGGVRVTADWSTGKVGMTGTSYNGTIPLAAATTGVQGLTAIIPVSPNTSYYRYYRSNGLVRYPGGYQGEDMDVLFDFIDSGNPERRAYCIQTIRDGELAAGEDRRTGDYNDFWAGRDLRNDLDGVKAATFLAHGLSDWNVMPEHSISVFKTLEARGVPVHLYLHQGGHGGPPPLPMMNRWFTHYLYGVENGVENEPPVWIVREAFTNSGGPDVPASNDPRMRAVRERAEVTEPTPYPDFPIPSAAPVELHLEAGGVQTGGLSVAARPDQGVETLVDNFSFSGEVLADAEWTNHRLLYVTPALNDTLHISGTPRITIRLASSKPAANLTVWLVSLPWIEDRQVRNFTIPGRGGVITRGWADPQNTTSLSTSQPLVPGRFYELTFDLQPDDQIIESGQRIGLMIMSSDHDFTLRPDPGTELTVDLDATSLVLPVVGGRTAFERSIRP